MRDEKKSFKDSKLFDEYGCGTMSDDVYQHPDEFERLMKTLEAQFPEAIRQISIGETFEGREIPAYLLALYQKDDNWK